MKNKRVQWKSFNINMPSELIPIYDFLQNELNFILSNDETRALLDKIDLSKLRGDVWRDLRDSLKFRIKDWPLHNKTWHSYILFENIRREIKSKQEAIIIWNELVKNDFNINEELFNSLHRLNLYPTRSRIANIKRSNSIPELPRNATFSLDYTISEKQFFRMKTNNICEIKVGKKDWIEYEIVFPSSIDERFTGVIAKPRFIKRKRDGQYIGVCSYEYEIGNYGLEDKILGIDIGKIKLFSSVVMDKNGEFSDEFINTKRSQETEYKINRLYENKQILFDKIKAYEDLKLTNQTKYEIWNNLYSNIKAKITNIKDYQAKLLSSEIVKLALEQKCKTIHIENLSWLNSQGGSWNHSQIHSKIIEKATMYGIEVKKVSAFNTSKEHPITKEIGAVQDRTVKFTTGEIDRDLLAAINIDIRSTNIKLKKSLPKKAKSKRVKLKSNKKEIKEKVNRLKGNGQIVSFLTNVLDSTIKVELGVRPLHEILPCNSLIDYYNKLQV
jgi:hypothetical protein